MKSISTPTISEILQKEFIEPMGLTLDDLSSYISKEQVKDILNNKVTPEISLSLAKIFNVSDNYFLNMQKDINKRNMQ